MKSLFMAKAAFDVRALIATASMVTLSLVGSVAFAQTAPATPPAEPVPATAPTSEQTPPPPAPEVPAASTPAPPPETMPGPDAAPPAAPVAPVAPAEPAPPPAAAATEPVAPAPEAVIFPGVNPLTGPPEGKGQIVFFRLPKFVGSALSFSIREGNTGIGKLQNGSYFVHVAEPGAREFNIQSEVTDTLRLEIEPGETYFVIQSITMGVVVGRPNLTPSDAATFQSKKLKVTTAKATDRKSKD